MSGPRITLLSRPGCHLCDDAREVIGRVADDLGVTWEERDITQSEADLREYWEKIPVTFVDGVPHDFWRVSEDRLRRALRLLPRGRRSAAAGALWSLPGRGAAAAADFVHLFTNDVW
jgi:glutaredoxin